MQLIDDLVTENAELQQQLTRAEETVRREQQQMRRLVHIHVVTCKGAPLGISPSCRGGCISVLYVVKTSLSFPVQEVGELQQQLQSSEREKEIYRQQLMRKEAELTRAEETFRREQQQMRQLVRVHVMGFPHDPTFITLSMHAQVVGFVCLSVCLSVCA